MSFMLFLRGFLGALAVFAVVTYVATQSWRTTLINTVICAVIIQVGYFAAVLAMIWRASARAKAAEPARKETASPAAKKDRPAVH